MEPSAGADGELPSARGPRKTREQASMEPSAGADGELQDVARRELLPMASMEPSAGADGEGVVDSHPRVDDLFRFNGAVGRSRR